MTRRLLRHLLRGVADAFIFLGYALTGTAPMQFMAASEQDRKTPATPPAAHPERLVPDDPLEQEALWAQLSDLDG